jgi:hypothetical protein
LTRPTIRRRPLIRMSWEGSGSVPRRQTASRLPERDVHRPEPGTRSVVGGAVREVETGAIRANPAQAALSARWAAVSR